MLSPSQAWDRSKDLSMDKLLQVTNLKRRLGNKDWLLRTPRGLNNQKNWLLSFFRAYNRNSGTWYS